MSTKKKKFNFQAMDNEMVAGASDKADLRALVKEQEAEPPVGLVAEGAFQCVCHPTWRKVVTLTFMCECASC